MTIQLKLIENCELWNLEWPFSLRFLTKKKECFHLVADVELKSLSFASNILFFLRFFVFFMSICFLMCLYKNGKKTQKTLKKRLKKVDFSRCFWKGKYFVTFEKSSPSMGKCQKKNAKKKVFFSATFFGEISQLPSDLVRSFYWETTLLQQTNT